MRDRASSHHRHRLEPALQLICLASGGGPAEDNVSGFLVRSVHTNWSKNSVLAVDAGTHLAAITRILDQSFPRVLPRPPVEGQEPTRDPPDEERRGKKKKPKPSLPNGRREPETRPHFDDDDCDSTCSSRATSPEPDLTVLASGPFQGLPFPHATSRANALHVVREHISTYLITHPHLDHISAFAINTAGFHNTTRPKRLAALPSTVHAIKTHIFNDVIWPNLSDEDGGVGFVTFQRLAEGGRLEVGEGSGKGYIEVCDGLCVKGMKISHGKCLHPHPAGRQGSDVGLSEATTRRPSLGAAPPAPAPAPEWLAPRRPSLNTLPRPPSLPNLFPPPLPPPGATPRPAESVVDSTAYFIRDDRTRRELLVFGDVEPDALSLHPRTALVWEDAAPKIAAGALRAIAIECSYDDAQPDGHLYGHLCPRHLVAELAVLARLVVDRRRDLRDRREARKRKRLGSAGPASPAEEAPVRKRVRGSPGAARDRRASAFSGSSKEEEMSPTMRAADGDEEREAAPLAGVRVLIMHIKDTMRDDVVVGASIQRQLDEHAARLAAHDGVGLGCEFVITEHGGSYFV